MFTMLLILSSVCYVNETTIADAPAFIDSIYDHTNDVYFEYEGILKGRISDDDANPELVWHTIDTFSGSLLFRKDSAIKLESYHSIMWPNSKRFTETNKLSELNGKSLRYEGREDLQGAETFASSYMDTFHNGSASRVYLVPFIKALAHYAPHRLVHQGDAMIDGNKCEIFSFVMGKDYETISVKNAALVFRFYLDMERGGHAIKYEMLLANEIVQQIIDIHLERFKSHTGDEYWFPVSSRFEGIMTKNSRSKEKFKPGTVINLETYSVMQGSIQFDKKPDDGKFKIRLKDGTLITDKIKNKQTKQGEKDRPASETLEQAQARLIELIREGEEKGTEISAGSMARGGGSSIMKRIPYTIGILSVTVLAFAAFIHRRVG
jgi:hypothetical protein